MIKKHKGPLSAWLAAFMVVTALPMPIEATLPSSPISFDYGDNYINNNDDNNFNLNDSLDSNGSISIGNGSIQITPANPNQGVTVGPGIRQPKTTYEYDPASGKEADSRHRITVDVTGTKRVIKEALGRKNIIDSIKVDEADEWVEVTYRGGKEYANQKAYVLLWTEEGFTLVTEVVANEKGKFIFTVESNAKYVISLVLPEELLNGEENLDNGWKFMDDDWYFFKEGQKLINSWIARDATEDLWYYVDQDGKWVKDIVIDGFVIDANGEWRA